MGHAADSLETLPLDVFERIDQICQRFEAAWRSGATPALEDYLAEAPAVGRPALLGELLVLELDYRRRRGDSLAFAEYARRFPDRAEWLRDAGTWADDDRAETRRAAGAAPVLPAPGPMVRQFGDFEVGRELGRGGMGIVYEVRQVSLNRRLALKMIRAGAFASDDELRRFRNEVEMVAALDHPGIVPILEIGRHEDQPYFSMPLIDGGSLTDRLDGFRDDPRAAARLMIDVADAVHHAHRRGILHRDLKPANILIDAEGRPHITDFGLAKRVEADDDLTQTGAIIGTPSYMAPEQTLGARGSITTATDVHGLGVILYALLTGRSPFAAATLFETIERVRAQAPQPPRGHNRQLPRDLERICLKCLEKAPERRYGSAEAFAQDLGRWLNGRPIKAQPAGAARRAWMWCRRKPLLAALAAGFLLALAGGIVGVASQWRRAERNLTLANTANDRLRAANDDLGTAQANLRRNLYAARMNLIQIAWEEGDIKRVRALLDLGRPGPGEPDPRGFEWYYWDRLGHAERLVLVQDLHAPWTVAYSPDGRLLASAGMDNRVRIWDAATGRAARVLAGHSDAIRVVAFSPDGTLLASAGLDCHLRLWEVATGRPLLADRQRAIPINTLAFHPEGRLLATGDWAGTIRLRDVPTGAERLRIDAHNDRVRSLAFRPDGRRLASAGFDHQVKIWDTATGGPLRTLAGHDDIAASVAYSPDGLRIASASTDRTVRIWDAETGAALHVLKGHSDWVLAVAYSPDGQILASAGRDRTVRLWDTRAGNPIRILKGHANEVTSLAFHPDGSRLASASLEDDVRVWEPGTQVESLAWEGHTDLVYKVAYSPDGRLLASAGRDGMVRVRDASSGQERFTLRGRNASIRGLAFRPDGRQIAAGGREGVLEVWALDGRGSSLAFEGPKSSIQGVAYSPDGRLLASAEADGAVRIWDVAARRERLALKGRGAVYAVAFSPDGTLLASVDHESALIFWDVANGRALRECLAMQDRVKANVGRLTNVAFSPDGRHVAVCGDRHTVLLFVVATGAPSLRFNGHTDTVWGVAFSPDGRRLVSGGDDGLVKVWDTASGNELLTLKIEASASHGVLFSPDGRRIAAACRDKIVRVWDAGPRFPATEIGPR